MIDNQLKILFKSTYTKLGPILRLREFRYSLRLRVFFGAFCFGLLIVLLISNSGVSAQSFKKVLILNSYNRGYPWTDNVMRGIDGLDFQGTLAVGLRLKPQTKKVFVQFKKTFWIVGLMIVGFSLVIIIMSANFRKRKLAEGALVREHNLLRSLIDNIPDNIYVKDTASRFVACNIAAMRYVGQDTLEEVYGKTDFDFLPQELASEYFDSEQEIFRTGQALINQEETNVEPCTGKQHYFVTTKIPFFDQQGKLLGLVGVSRNITEFKQVTVEVRQLNAELEERVTQRTAQLAAANQELEAFSYSVSHDLRAPLRAIDGFSRILIDDFAKELSPQAFHYLNSICRNSIKMGQLIDDLLAFSRMSRTEMECGQIDMQAMVQMVFDDLRSQVPERQIILRLGTLQPGYGDRVLIQQVIHNLLANAIKFSKNEAETIIKVGCSQESGAIIYYVKDNGVGFEMKYSDKLFGVFQRLHTEAEFEGTGVGLAIVQRIINRHGGRVWAEGQEGRGATFYFSLPWNENQKGY